MNTQTHQQFLEARQGGLGGSDMAAILGLSKWKTPLDVYRSKVEPVEEEEEQSEPAYWGHVLEDVVAKEYQRREGRKVQRINKLLIHPELDCARANIDRAVVNPEIAGNVRFKDGKLTTDRGLECKTGDRFTAHFWGEAGTDEVPEYYLVQCQWYMAITGVPYWDLSVLIGGNDFRTYHLERDDELIADLLAEAEAFWRRVEQRDPPEPMNMDDAHHLWPEHIKSKSTIVGVDVAQLCLALNELKAEEKKMKMLMDEVKLEIVTSIGDAEQIAHKGEKIATWKAQDTTRIDTKALREAHPEIAEAFSKTTTSRVLRLSTKLEEIMNG